MRQMLTLLGILITFATFASDRDRFGTADLRISSSSYENYEVRIDGRTYRLDRNDLRLNNISTGYHRIEVYRIERRSNGLFGMRNRTVLVHNSGFHADRNERIFVNINRYGNVDVREIGGDKGWGRNDDRYDRRDNDRRNDDRRNDEWGKGRNGNGKW